MRALALDTRLGYETAQREFVASRRDFPVRGYRLTNCEDSFGDSLSASKNAIHCFDSAQLEDCEASYHVTKARDCMDIQHTHDAELCFELMASTGVYNCHFSANPIQSRYILYSYLVTSCRDCFGCAGLKSQKFCILNTPYSESEYRTLRTRLIGHMRDTGEWGEFFPPELSLYPYNHTLASIYFPEDTGKRNDKKLRVSAPLPGIVEVHNALAAAELPNLLSLADDALFERAIICDRSKRPFRISKAELALRRKLSAPVASLHPDERFRDRLEFQNKKKLHSTNCAQCQTSTFSIYDPAATAQKILCDRCYEALVYA